MDTETYHSLRHEVEELQAENGIELAMLINVSDALSNLFSWMLRVKRFDLDELAQYLTLDNTQVVQIIKPLQEKGIILDTNQAIQNIYEVKLKLKQEKKSKGLSKSIWEKLE